MWEPSGELTLKNFLLKWCKNVVYDQRNDSLTFLAGCPNNGVHRRVHFNDPKLYNQLMMLYMESRLINKSTDYLVKTIIFTGLALIAFAANSVLCRLALGERAIDASSFTIIRLLSGAIVLLAILSMNGNKTGRIRKDFESNQAGAN